MNFWTYDNIRKAIGGSWLVRPGLEGRPAAQNLEGVSTDSRTLRPGQVFVALRGERFDGHHFLAEALQAGAPLLIVESSTRLGSRVLDLVRDRGVLKVADTGLALMRLAGAYRRTLEGTRVIAVTGSNGKTTTTRLVHALLGSKLRGTASIKSFNNEIGVPLTILSARPSDQFLICEVGANAPGEIAALARIVEPDVAVITSIGRAHIEGFGSIENVAREKASLLSHLSSHGVAIVPAGEARLADYLKTVPHVITFGSHQNADLRLTEVEPMQDQEGTPTGIRFEINGRTHFELGLIGRHNATNAIAAIAVARRFGLADDSIAEVLRTIRPAENRLQIAAVGAIRLVDDSYNANPDSMLAAMQTFHDLVPTGVRRVFILGDMLELGEAALEAHAEIGRAIAERFRPDVLMTIGRHARHIAEASSLDRRVILTYQHLNEQAAAEIVELLQPGDAVLLKGSRGVGLDRIVHAIRSQFADRPAVTAGRGDPA